MMTRHCREQGEALSCPPRPRYSAVLPPLAGLFLAAGFVISLACRHEGELIRAERIRQEIIGR